MKKRTFLTALLAVATGLAACNDDNDQKFSGSNRIYLSTEGSTSIFESDAEPIVVDVMLSSNATEELTLTFAVEGTPAGVVALEGNPVTIPSGTKNAQFSIRANNGGLLTESASYRIVLAEDAALPEGMSLAAPFGFTVSPAPSGELSEEQKALIEAFKQSSGIDLARYMGEVPVSTVYTGTDVDTGEPLDPKTLTGKTVITLSASATAEQPVLKMTYNPMGIRDELYKMLRARTIDNDAYWFDENSQPSYRTLVEAIAWTKTSDEVFSVTLDGIRVNADGTLDYTGTRLDAYDEEITVVPFAYGFTAYDRELAALADGSLVHDADWAPDATADPAYHLNASDISEDAFEAGNWIETAGSVSNEKMEFTFCFYGTDLDSDYTKVVATYTPAE